MRTSQANARNMIAVSAAACLGLAAGVAAMMLTDDSIAAEASRHVRNRFWVKNDSEVMHMETAPHDGKGMTKAYRYFDEVKDAGVIFRKRAIPKGGFIGMHVLNHDEVYYVVSGKAEVTVDDTKKTMNKDSAVFMHEGADVGIKQLGDEDLVIIIAYPPAK